MIDPSLHKAAFSVNDFRWLQVMSNFGRVAKQASRKIVEPIARSITRANKT
jgi:hypothetical protein